MTQGREINQFRTRRERYKKGKRTDQGRDTIKVLQEQKWRGKVNVEGKARWKMER